MENKDTITREAAVSGAWSPWDCEVVLTKDDNQRSNSSFDGETKRELLGLSWIFDDCGILQRIAQRITQSFVTSVLLSTRVLMHEPYSLYEGHMALFWFVDSS